MGIAYQWKDRIDKSLTWKKSVDLNDDNLLYTRPVFNSTLIQQNIDFDFTQRVYKVDYFNAFDLLAKIGGLRSSVMPVILLLIPWIALNFLQRLGHIIDRKMMIC